MKTIKLLLILVLFYSCEDSVSIDGRLVVKVDQSAMIQKGPLSVLQVVYKKQYGLEKLTVKREKLLENGKSLNLQFEEELPEGYEIHYTVNNGQLQKCSSSSIEIELLEGNNIVLAFLALTNGIRIPNEHAIYIKNHAVGEIQQVDITDKGVHLFHNLSVQADSANTYLDFYGKNIPEGSNYFARITADGNQFNVPINRAFKINGLTKEYHNIRIQLVDGNGKVVPGPFNDTGVMSLDVK